MKTADKLLPRFRLARGRTEIAPAKIALCFRANRPLSHAYFFPLRGIMALEVIIMSPKELQYIEDALGHEKFLTGQCQQAMSQLSDPELKNTVNQMLIKHQELFDRFYQLV